MVCAHPPVRSRRRRGTSPRLVRGRDAPHGLDAGRDTLLGNRRVRRFRRGCCGFGERVPFHRLPAYRQCRRLRDTCLDGSARQGQRTSRRRPRFGDLRTGRWNRDGIDAARDGCLGAQLFRRDRRDGDATPRLRVRDRLDEGDRHSAIRCCRSGHLSPRWRLQRRHFLQWLLVCLRSRRRRNEQHPRETRELWNRSRVGCRLPRLVRRRRWQMDAGFRHDEHPAAFMRRRPRHLDADSRDCEFRLHHRGGRRRGASRHRPREQHARLAARCRAAGSFLPQREGRQGDGYAAPDFRPHPQRRRRAASGGSRCEVLARGNRRRTALYGHSGHCRLRRPR